MFSPGGFTLKSVSRTSCKHFGDTVMEGPSDTSITNSGEVQTEWDIKLYNFVQKATNDGLRKEGMALVAYIDMGMPSLFVHPRGKYGQINLDKHRAEFNGKEGDLICFLELYKGWKNAPKRERPLWCSERFIDHPTILKIDEKVSRIQRALPDDETHDECSKYSDKNIKDTVANILVETFYDDLCVFSGHNKLGYIHVKTKGLVRLSPDSSVFVMNFGSPDVVLIPGIAKVVNESSFNCVSGCIRVTKDVLENLNHTPEGQKTLQRVYQTEKLKSFTVEPVGSTVMHELFNNGQVHVIEDKIIAKIRCPFVKIDKAENTIEIFCLPSHAYEVDAIVREGIERLKVNVVREETVLVNPEKDGPSLLVKPGGLVKDIKFAYNSAIVVYYLNQGGDRTIEKDVREAFKKYGTITDVKPIEGCAKILSEAWGVVHFLEPWGAKMALNDIQHVNKAYNYHIEEFNERRKFLTNPNGTHRIICNVRRKKRPGTIRIEVPSKNVCHWVRQYKQRIKNFDEDFNQCDILVVVPQKREPYTVWLYNCYTGKSELELLEILEMAFQSHIIDLEFISDTPNKAGMLFYNTVLDILKWQPGLERLNQMDCAVESFVPNSTATWSRTNLIFSNYETAENILKYDSRDWDDSQINIQRSVVSSYFISRQKYNAATNQGIDIKTWIEISEVKEEDPSFSVVERDIDDDMIQVNIYWQDKAAYRLFMPLFLEMLEPLQYKCTILDSLYLRKRLQAMYSCEIICDEKEDTTEEKTLSIYSSRHGKEKISEYLKEFEKQENQIIHAIDLKLFCITSMPHLLVSTFGSSLELLVEQTGADFLDLDMSQRILLVRGTEVAICSVLQTLSQLWKQNEEVVGPILSTDIDETGVPDCAACLCAIDGEAFVLSICGHSYCNSCFAMQCHSSISTKSFPIKCALADCETPVAFYDIEKAFSRKESKADLNCIMEKFCKGTLDIFVANNKELKYCTTPECGLVYLAGNLKGKKWGYKCPKCQHVMCCNCSEPYHPGLSCNVNEKMKKLEIQETKLTEWIKEKPDDRKMCPNCETGIEKNLGCSNVFCVTCNKSVCWVCLEYFDVAQECYDHIEKEHSGEAD